MRLSDSFEESGGAGRTDGTRKLRPLEIDSSNALLPIVRRILTQKKITLKIYAFNEMLIFLHIVNRCHQGFHESCNNLFDYKL